MEKLINCTAALVEEELERYLENKDICSCERCMLDMKAHAMNNLAPKYIVSDMGYLYQKIAEMRIQNSVDVLKAIIDAVEVVSKNPNH